MSNTWRRWDYPFNRVRIKPVLLQKLHNMYPNAPSLSMLVNTIIANHIMGGGVSPLIPSNTQMTTAAAIVNNTRQTIQESLSDTESAILEILNDDNW